MGLPQLFQNHEKKPPKAKAFEVSIFLRKTETSPLRAGTLMDSKKCHS
jgi:hypothetical protein